ncbi:hypothetical protein OTC26_026735 [Streptomyces tirandamycinicus]|uniref:hypothetical protein n=1 Tax=Streptomyces tirandamycinicus TaxID=2174846 RepID=UPI00226E96EB|nr:hypothetical protein [Streptomyces tirandamycinicus]MCY0985385.1 hypothetical protein [Streptomyces tirandamycinicus]
MRLSRAEHPAKAHIAATIHRSPTAKPRCSSTARLPLATSATTPTRASSMPRILGRERRSPPARANSAMPTGDAAAISARLVAEVVRPAA